VTIGSAAAVAGGVAVAVAMWTLMFRVDRGTIWQRTSIAAVVVSGYAVAAVAALGRIRRLLGPVSPAELGIGLAAGVAWVIATHLGADVLGRVAPSFVDQVADLYDLAGPGSAIPMGSALVAMAVAEELLFRGLIQGEAGIVVAVVLYAAVQVVERKWPLVLAGALCGLVWGGVFAWRGGLVAPVVAHIVWTSTLTLAWPLRSTGAARPEHAAVVHTSPDSGYPSSASRGGSHADHRADSPGGAGT
jgi:membrane protease YdiL (CAAX protease family)